MRNTASSPPSGAVVALALTGILLGMLLSGCGSQGAYSRQPTSDSGVDQAGTAGMQGIGGEGGSASGGAGGQIIGAGTGGELGGGGVGGTVVGSGGAGTGGPGGLGGAVGSGGVRPGTGGAGTGGIGTGGAGTGGTGTGGAGTGGAGTGGAAGGSVATGGAGGTVVGTGGTGPGGQGGGGTGPRIVSIDFVGGLVQTGSTVTPAPAMASTETAGFKPAMHWNSAAGVMGTLSTLTFSDGSTSGATATWNAPVNGSNPGSWKNAFPDMAGDTRMMNGYLDPSSVSLPATVTVSGLPSAVTAAGYDVYVYAMGDIQTTSTRVYKYAIGAASFSVSQTGPSPTTFPGYKLVPAAGGNYVVFRNLNTASFTLTATPSTGNTLRAPLNGIQIVSPSGP